MRPESWIAGWSRQESWMESEKGLDRASESAGNKAGNERRPYPEVLFNSKNK